MLWKITKKKPTMPSTSTHWRYRNLGKEQRGKILKLLGYDGPFLKPNPAFFYNAVQPDKLLPVFRLLETLGASQADWYAIFPPINDKRRFCRVFDDIEELPLPLAFCLGMWKCRLFLNSLKNLSAEAAVHLANASNELSLCGVESICDATAEALGRHKAPLYLGIQELSATAARYLSRHEGELHLDRLEWISQEAAIQLSGFTSELGLHAIKEIHPVVCGHFVEKRNVHFPYTIADKIACYEGNLDDKERGRLEAPLYQDLEANIQGVCDRMTGSGANYGDWYLVFGGTRSELFFKDFVLSIPGLKRMPLEMARFLFAGYIEKLYLDDLVEIEAEALGFLRLDIYWNCPEGLISLRGLESLDDASAEELAKCKGPVHLGYPKMSGYARKLLEKKNVKYFGSDDWELELEG